MDFELGLSASAAAMIGSPGPNPAPWSPTDLSNLAIWVDLSDLSTMFVETTGAAATTPAVVDGVVGTIRDKGPNGYYLTAPSDAARPILRKTGNRYYLHFDGVDDQLKYTGAGFPRISQPNTIAYAGYSPEQYGTVFTGVGHILGVSPSGTRLWAGTQQFIEGRSDTEPQTLVAFYNGSNSYVRHNGVQTAAGGDIGSGELRQVAFPNPDVELFFYGLVIADDEVASDELGDLENYLADKAGVGLSPPVWKPTDLPGTVIWLDPSDLSTMWQETTGASATTSAEVDGVVGTILDKGPNGHYLVAPSDAARPILRKVGELYYLEFDGVDDRLKVISTTIYNQPNVAALGARLGDAGRFFDGNGGVERHILTLGTHYVQQYAGNWGGGKTGKTTSTAQVITTHWEGESSYIRYDGGTELVGNAGTNPYKAMTIGTDFSGSHPGVADIYSVIFHDGALSNEDRAKLETHIAEKTGVSL
ncbi:MAG: hypothetical protein AAGA50_27760 [Pseudomonadota bacterium]